MSLSRRAFAGGLALTPLVKAKQQTEHSAPVATDAQPSGESPRFFDSHQLETVAVVAELIIPQTDTRGARAAMVHEHLDRILALSPEAARTKFLEGLWWLDGYALRSGGKPFKDVAPTQQAEILTKLYDSSDADLRPGRDFVVLAKNWTAKIYYSTEIGQQELNKGGRVPEKYNSYCSH
jgi:gluconate 2-dehydrogenase gamma chain